MSTYYGIFAEVRAGDKWYNLNPIVKNDNGYTIMPVISGYSYMREAIDELREETHFRGRPDDLSPEVREYFGHEDDEVLDWYPKTTYKEYYGQTLFVVNYNKAVERRYNKKHPTRFRGYAYKWAVTEFEIGNNEHISHWISEFEYKELSDEDKEEYTYYEWDEFDDWYPIFGQIMHRIEALLAWFSEWSYSNIQGLTSDEHNPTGDRVRLIIEQDF